MPLFEQRFRKGHTLRCMFYLDAKRTTKLIPFHSLCKNESLPNYQMSCTCTRERPYGTWASGQWAMFIEALCCSKGMHWWFEVHVNDKRTWKAIELSGSLLYKWSDLRSLRKRTLFVEAITITVLLVCVVCKRFDAKKWQSASNASAQKWRFFAAFAIKTIPRHIRER